MGRDAPPSAPSLDAVRARIDAVDAELLRLIDERASLAAAVADAKRAAGEGGKFGLRPGREAQVMRRLLAEQRDAATAPLVVRIWREIMGDSLSRQGPFHLSVSGDARTVEFARVRFGVAPALAIAAKPEDALAAARTPGGVAVLSLKSDTPWWGRLLAQPTLKVFSVMPCLAQWGLVSALAVAEVEVEPTSADVTFWVTDAAGPTAGIIEALGRDGAAASLLADAGGLKLFGLSGFYQADDARLARAPGRLSGVIGAAPEQFDV